MQEKATLENRLSNLIDMKLDDYMNKNAYLSKEKEINDKIKEIDDKISNYQNRLKTNKDISKQLKIVEEILSASKTINDFNEETFNNLVEKIIVGEVDEDGNVYPNTINFILKVGSSYQYEINDDKTVSFRTTTWKNSPNGKILETDVVIAKNYLSKGELEQLELIVSAFLDLAEARAKRHIPMTMEDWSNRIDKFLLADDLDVLKDAGKISHEIAAIKH